MCVFVVLCRVVFFYAALPPCNVCVCAVSIAALPLAFLLFHSLITGSVSFGKNGDRCETRDMQKLVRKY
jgi:hypothetical protein